MDDGHILNVQSNVINSLITVQNNIAGFLLNIQKNILSQLEKILQIINNNLPSDNMQNFQNFNAEIYNNNSENETYYNMLGFPLFNRGDVFDSTDFFIRIRYYKVEFLTENITPEYLESIGFISKRIDVPEELTLSNITVLVKFKINLFNIHVDLDDNRRPFILQIHTLLYAEHNGENIYILNTGVRRILTDNNMLGIIPNPKFANIVNFS